MSEHTKYHTASPTLKIKVICSQNPIVKYKHHKLFSSRFLYHSLMEAIVDISPKIK